MAIVTLSTDIGQQDYLVGAIKGQLLMQDATFNIVDITHYLTNTNFPQAAYITSNAFKHFPVNTFHIVILNYFDTSVNHLLVAMHNEQYIICPDNGILTMIAGEKPTNIAKIALRGHHTLLSRTAVVAQVIHYITQHGKFAVDAENPIVINEKYPLKAMVGANWIEGQILFIDQFENVVVNITQQEFEEKRAGRKFNILFTRDDVINSISNNYSDAADGDKLAFFNSAGYLEIAINKGNMAGIFGLQGYHEQMNKIGSVTKNKWFYQSVKVFFID